MNDLHPIEVRNITKRYSIAHSEQHTDHQTVKDALVRVVRKPLKMLDSFHGTEREDLWALNGISFDVKQGQVMAVMGRNGSGKTTLFKVLSKITNPTSGKAVIRGKIGSLIEVDAGFHPELTGRENVYFNGSILGMSKSEIDEKFDRIVEFSEIEKFIDTPVKFYSSGMKVRLGFSVAAHLDTDILLMDEVLAVGDYEFKLKCFEKMEEVAKAGKTILFVSHLPAHVRRICTHGILMKDGDIIFTGEIEDVIERYMGENKNALDEDSDLVRKETSSPEKLPGLQVADTTATAGVGGGSMDLKVKTVVANVAKADIRNVRITFSIKDADNNVLAGLSSSLTDSSFDVPLGKSVSVTLKTSGIVLPPGQYNISIRLVDDHDPKLEYQRKLEAAWFTAPEHSLTASDGKGSQPVEFGFDFEAR